MFGCWPGRVPCCEIGRVGVSEGSERGQGEGGGRSARERPCVESKVRANEERRAKSESGNARRPSRASAAAAKGESVLAGD